MSDVPTFRPFNLLCGKAIIKNKTAHKLAAELGRANTPELELFNTQRPHTDGVKT